MSKLFTFVVLTTNLKPQFGKWLCMGFSLQLSLLLCHHWGMWDDQIQRGTSLSKDTFWDSSY